MPVIRILIADGQQLVRDKLRQLIETQKDMIIIDEARCGTEALVKVQALHPQILLLDIAMPRRNGLPALELITAAAPDTKVIIMSLHQDDIYVHEVFKAGAMGYQVKTGPANVLLRTIRMATHGERRRYFHGHIL